jgi:AraC-like DNA-binding protein
VRGFIVGERPDPVLLRSQICDSLDLAACVTAWLRRMNVTVCAETCAIMTELLESPPDATDLADIAGSSSKALGWRRAFKTRRLGRLGQWCKILRMLKVALRVQSATSVPLIEIALRYGYSDASSLSRALNETVGVRPVQIREWIGWEVILFYALRRAGLMPARQPASISAS